MVDGEVLWHEDHPSEDEDDQLLDVLTQFFNWLSERMEQFEEDLAAATRAFKDVCVQFGEDELKEPADLFETLEKFLMRFEAACKEVDDLQKERAPKKGRVGRLGRPGGAGAGVIKIKPKGSDIGAPSAPAAPGALSPKRPTAGGPGAAGGGGAPAGAPSAEEGMVRRMGPSTDASGKGRRLSGLGAMLDARVQMK
mmetsp:Transcript_67976/g.179171  ORF Transcript_67976/g.179171 Transcript_67976/m.179171 type:complete len:196 (+) Transcript_67976:1192-1779(+)